MRTLDPDQETLVGVASLGSWHRLDVSNGQVAITQLGQYGAGDTSAGDAYSIDGQGTCGACNKTDVTNGTVIVSSNPTHRNVLTDVATIVGYTTVDGNAGWEGSIFAFNSGGEVMRIDPTKGSYEQLFDTSKVWWGAGVFTVLPQ